MVLARKLQNHQRHIADIPASDVGIVTMADRVIASRFALNKETFRHAPSAASHAMDSLLPSLATQRRWKSIGES
jgi:hypothetical protein